ncbi:MAG: hypothetical protein HGA85_01595 [Nanoarchaeota archaeon]|nr:hypothetical protein [Nanoarchaeota archaeon]
MKTKTVWMGIVLCLALLLVNEAMAQQTGATVTNSSWSTKNASTPQSRNDSRGTITTVSLNAEQQNSKWKAYVGNVSSTFVLDDSGGYSIYQWTMDSFSGQVYITRNNSISWAGVTCAGLGDKSYEDTVINHNSTRADSVNRTFVAQTHKAFTVGSTAISQNTCYSTATWKNDTAQVLSTAIPFQEVLLTDGNDMIYTTFVEDNMLGYKPESNGVTYDFQAIVPDDGIGSNPLLTYFFYLELS